MKTTRIFATTLWSSLFLVNILFAQSAIVCPPDVTVSCNNFDPGLTDYGIPGSLDSCGQNTLTVTVNLAQFDTLCRRGAISRTFQALDCFGNNNVCTQQIMVSYEQDYYIRFPDDVILTNCTSGISGGEPIVFGADCPLLSVTYDDMNYLLTDVCTTITRGWTIVNWCAYDPTKSIKFVPNPHPNAVSIDPGNFPGPTVSACNAMPPWSPTIVKINPNDAVPTNFCDFWSDNPNGYYYEQLIRIVDFSPPTIANCPTGPVTFADTTGNDLALWRNANNAALPVLDLTEVATDLTITASDSCSGENINISYELFLDLDGDGTVETVVKSNQLGGNLNNVLYGNVTGVGQPFAFDNRPVPTNEKWGFAIQQTISGVNKTASVRFNTSKAPNTYITPQLPQGTHKIKWSLEDACGNVSTCEQVFTIQEGPENLLPMIVCPANITVGTSFSLCVGFYPYTVDFSGGVLSQTAGLPSGTFPLGVTINQFVVTDTLGNTASCSFTVTVRDMFPPVVNTVESILVVIGLDDPQDCYGSGGNDNLGGVSSVKVAAFDEGSYDDCGNVLFTIRRYPPYSDCILGLNQVNGQPNCDDVFPDFPSEFERAIAESDSIKFYCCEVGTFQHLMFRVYQLNPDGTFSTDEGGMPIYSEELLQVFVEDHLKPTCIPPPNVTVSCDSFDPTLMAYGVPEISDNCCLDTQSATLNLSQFDTLCNRGTISRVFQAVDCRGNSRECTQRIVVNYTQDYYIRFPDDVITTTCPSGFNFGEPTFFGESCELIGVSYADEIITVVPDACYKIERNWSVINWCTFNPALDLINIPNPNPNAIVNHPSNLPGPIVSPCNTQPPWNATVVKISPVDTAATNYCTFWNGNANGYKYHQTIKILDFTDPVISNCPATTVNFADSSLNDPLLWHNVFNPSQPSQDLTEAGVNLSLTCSDDCSGGNLNASFLLFLDLDNDGLLETVVNSANPPGADTLYYNNVNTPGYLGGTPVTFDARPVPTNQKWHFTLQPNAASNQGAPAVRWNTALDPTTFVVPQLPRGTHKIRWFIGDNCGNEKVCEYLFVVQEGVTSGIETLDDQGFALYQNEPNPFKHSTTIGFRLPNAAEAVLTVYNAEGKQLFSKTGQYGQGYNALTMEGAWLDVPGVLLYKLQSEGKVAWRKMVLVR